MTIRVQSPRCKFKVNAVPSPKDKARAKARIKALAKAKAKAANPTPRHPLLTFRLCQYKETISAPLNALFLDVVNGFIEKARKARAPFIGDPHVCGVNLYKSVDATLTDRDTVASVLRVTEGRTCFWIKGRAV
jgi:hypothetical protein